MRPVIRLPRSTDPFEPRGRALSIARSLLAAAQLTTLLFTSDQVLQLHTGSSTGGDACAGPGSLTLWCVLPAQHPALLAGRLVVALVLVGVIAGYRPRLLCIPHCYIAFSLAAGQFIADGASAVAQILTVLFIPLCLGDPRIWQWTVPGEPLKPGWQGSAHAAHLVLRAQIAIIYMTAAVSKLRYSSWRNGTAVRTILADPAFDGASHLRSLVETLLAPRAVSDVVTWGAVITELSIAIFSLLNARGRRYALILGISLHTAIAVSLGLFAFGLTMIALLLSIQASGYRLLPQRDDLQRFPIRLGRINAQAHH